MVITNTITALTRILTDFRSDQTYLNTDTCKDDKFWNIYKILYYGQCTKRLKFPSKMVDFFQVAEKTKSETTELRMTTITDGKGYIILM